MTDPIAEERVAVRYALSGLTHGDEVEVFAARTADEAGDSLGIGIIAGRFGGRLWVDVPQRVRRDSVGRPTRRFGFDDDGWCSEEGLCVRVGRK